MAARNSPGAPGSGQAARVFDLAFTVPALLMVAGAGLAQALWGSLISAGNGIGWDGEAYARYAMDFGGQVLGGKVDAYRLQRVLPSGIVHLLLRAFSLPRDAPHVVSGFLALNLALLAASVPVWRSICRAAHVSDSGRWLGLLLLFVSFANLRMPYYYPVLTDTTAFALGGLLVYFHLVDSVPGMLVCLGLGAFTFPTFLIVGAPLVLFPRGSLGPPRPAGRARVWVVSFGIAVYLAGLLAVLPAMQNPPNGYRPWTERGLLVGLPLTLAYLIAAYASLFDHQALFDWRTYAARVRPPRVLAWLALAAAAFGLVAAFASSRRPPADVQRYVSSLLFLPVVQPAISLVAHTVYFGLLVPILVVNWTRASRKAHELGPGLVLFVTAFLALGLHSESRQLQHGLVAFTLLAVLAVEDVRWPSWAGWLLSVLALVGSKVWLDLNGTGFAVGDSPNSFPAQNFFGNLGPWMTDETYRIHAVAVAGVALSVVALRFFERPATEAEIAAARPAPRRLVLAACGVIALLATLEGAARLALRLRPENEQSAPSPDANKAPLQLRLQQTGCRAEVLGPQDLQAAGSRDAADLAVLLVSAADLCRLASGDADKQVQPPQPRHPLRHSAALRVLSNATQQWSPPLHRRLAALGIVERGAPPRDLCVYGPTPEAGAVWGLTSTLLIEWRQAFEKTGGRVVVLYVPARFEIEEQAWQDTLDRYRMSPRFWSRTKPLDRLRPLLAERGVTLVDPTPELRAAKSGYLEHPFSWTPAGHAAAAAALRRALGEGCGARSRN